MFNIGWSEILIIASVALVVVGPKDLPRMLRTFGRTMGMVRRTANDFKRQFDDALREAERDAGLEGTADSLKSIGNPLADLRKGLTSSVMGDTGKKTAAAKPSEAPAAAATTAHESAPLKGSEEPPASPAPAETQPAATAEAPAPATEGSASAPASPQAPPQPATAEPSPSPAAASDVHEAEPLKTGAANAQRGSDAA